MITVNNLTYAYQGSRHKVFDGFSLRIEGNGIYGLLGKNGTGKSTLLYLISGLLRPSKGTVEIDGRCSFDRKPEMMADLFLVPEEFDLPDCSLDEYVRVNSVFYPRFSREMLDECLKDFEVEPGANLRSLSMGQKKRVFMSYALATNTRLLLMDEPTNGLDIPSKSLFRKVVAKNMTDDRTLIISTHQVHDIENLLDHIVIIDNSRVLLDAPVAGITDRYAFRTIPASEAEGAVYSEPSMGGLNAIMRREDDEPETQVNLELLFNAAVKEAIPSLCGGDDMADRQSASHQSDTPAPPQDEGGTLWRTLRWHLADNKKQLAYSAAGGLLAVAVPALFLLLFGGFPNSVTPIAAYLAFVLGAYLLTCGAFVIGRLADKRRRIMALLLPASKLQGFLCRYAMVTIALPLAAMAGIVAGDALQMALFKLADGDAYSVTLRLLSYIGNAGGDTDYKETLGVATVCVMINAVYLLFGTFFRRHAWIKGSLVLTATTMVIPTVLIFGFKLALDTYYGTDEYSITVTGDTVSNVVTAIVSTAMAALCYWGAYRIYARMQAVGNKWHNL